MRLGLIVPQQEIGVDLDDLEAYARTAEECGFDYLNIYDHVLGADRATRPDWSGPYDLEDGFHEPFVFYGWLAALVRLELVTGVIILPQRQTALVAKQAAELDLLCRGRMRLGVGIGWNAVEYDALGYSFRTRGRRFEEQVELLRRLWTEPSVTFDGEFDRIDHTGIAPMPVQRPIPIWMGGGATPAVVERIGRISDGWICNLALDSGIEGPLEMLWSAVDASGRDREQVGLQLIVKVGDGLDQATVVDGVARGAALGATHVSFDPGRLGRSPGEHIEFVRTVARHLGDRIGT